MVKNARNEAETIEEIIVAMDVTERKNYEVRLEETTQKLRALSNYLQRVREERLYIANGIFDDQLGQDLTVLKMDLSMLGKSSAKTAKEKNIPQLDAVHRAQRDERQH